MADNYCIREASANDADAACAVLRRSITELCQLDYEGVSGRLDQWLANKTPEQVRGWLAQEGFTLLLAQQDSAIAGVSGMTDQGMILLNYVSPDWRFRGVSTALLVFMEERALKAGNHETQLESSKTALSFYQSRGYQTNPAKAGKTGLWLIKSLI